MNPKNWDKDFFKQFDDPHLDADSEDICQDEEPAGKEQTLMIRICYFLLRLQDNNLEGRYFLRFNKWLKIDNKALRCYVDMSILCGQLHQVYRDKQLDVKSLEMTASLK